MVWHAACPGNNDDQLLHYAVYDVSEQQQVGIPVVVTDCMYPIITNSCACMYLPLPCVHPDITMCNGKLSLLLQTEYDMVPLLMLCTGALCYALLYCIFNGCSNVHALPVCSPDLRLLQHPSTTSAKRHHLQGVVRLKLPRNQCQYVYSNPSGSGLHVRVASVGMI